MLAVLLTVSAHVYPELVLQLGSSSNLQEGYQIIMGHPRMQYRTDIMPLLVKVMT